MSSAGWGNMMAPRLFRRFNCPPEPIEPCLLLQGSLNRMQPRIRKYSSVSETRITRMLKSVKGVQEPSQVKQAVSLSRCESLRGRDLVDVYNYTTAEIHSILWTALHIKSRPDEVKVLCRNQNIFLCYDDFLTKLAVVNGASSVGANVTSVPSSEMELNKHFDMVGKALSSAADIVLLESSNFTTETVDSFSAGCTVPVINLRSQLFATLFIMSELLTLFEHYGLLKRLSLTYIGPHENAYLNTYAVLLPKVGVHFRFLTDSAMNSDVWSKAIELAAKNQTNFNECTSLEEAVYRVHAVASSYHSDSDPRFILNVKHTEEMDLNWTILHHDVHKKSSVPAELLKSNKSLIWKSIENMKWITAAIIAMFTDGFEPSSPCPSFDGPSYE